MADSQKRLEIFRQMRKHEKDLKGMPDSLKKENLASKLKEIKEAIKREAVGDLKKDVHRVAGGGSNKITTDDVIYRGKVDKVPDKGTMGGRTAREVNEANFGTAEKNKMDRRRDKMRQHDYREEMTKKDNQLKREARGQKVDDIVEGRRNKAIKRQGLEEAASKVGKSGAKQSTKQSAKQMAKKTALNMLKKGGPKAAGFAAAGLLGKALLGPGVALASEAFDAPAAGLPVNRGISSGIEQGKFPSRLSEATMGALRDIAALKRKKKKNLVEE